ncbi:MAG: glycosyltransferase [Chitinophagales bacterium]
MNDTNIPIQLTLVVPCYNEADRVGLLYGGLDSFIDKWKNFLEIIIINDGSKDNTETLLHEHDVYKRHKDIISIYTQANTGKGGALKNGVSRARGNYILTLDADMASPPEELIKWLDLLHGRFAANTIYVGSREHKDSIITKQGDRKLAGNIFNFIVRILSPLKIRDTQCGFKLYPADIAKEIFESLQTYGWAHDVEVLYKAYLKKVNIVEMPLTWNAIEGSKISLVRDGFNMMKEILIIVARTRVQYRKK